MRKIVLAVLLSSFLLGGKVFAGNVNYEDYLHEFSFIETQIQAIAIDMSVLFMWPPDDKKVMKDSSKKAVADIEKIKKHLESLQFPPELTELKDRRLKLIDEFESVYRGMENKSQEQIDREFKSFEDHYAEFGKYSLGIYEKYMVLDENQLGEKFDPTSEDIKLAKTEEDKKSYSQALAHINKGDFDKAYEILTALFPKYKKTPFGDCIKLRMAQCLYGTDSDLTKNRFDDELRLLSEIVDGNAYSPVLAEAFHRWRTEYQAYNHGMSNMSEIPNDEYNQKRWLIVQRIKQYLKKNPSDIWAKAQIDQILSIPNIERGGPYGNSNLNHVAVFMTEKQKKEAGISK